MEKENQNDVQNDNNRWHRHHHHSRVGKVFAGILVLAVGALLLSKQLGAEYPHWLLSWKTMLIAIGLFIGFRHSFRNFKGLIPIIIGVAFLMEDFFPNMEISMYFWPIMLMVVGLIIIFKPRRSHPNHWRKWKDHYRGKWENNYTGDGGFNSSDDLLDAVAVFGSVKKNIISKDFKGGEITCVFGGGVINLSQADINGKILLEINAVFGGVKLVVPQNWEIQTSELVTVMGGIDDKRPQQSSSQTSDKILILKGSAVFGGIEILNY